MALGLLTGLISFDGANPRESNHESELRRSSAEVVVYEIW